MLLDRQEICQDLRRVKFVRQAVPDRHACVFCKRLYDLLSVSAVFNAVIHAAKHAGGVGDGFLFADLRAGRVKIRDRHAEIMRGDLK